VSGITGAVSTSYFNPAAPAFGGSTVVRATASSDEIDALRLEEILEFAP